MAPWCSGLTYRPVKPKIAGSNPVGVARSFFGIFILCILAAFCSGGCGRWWDAELNESLIDDEVIIDIKKNIKKYEHINKDITELCVICLEEYSIEDNILILDCNHYYHSECLINWFKKNIDKYKPDIYNI